MSLNILSKLLTLNTDSPPEKEFHTVQDLDLLLSGNTVDYELPGNVINFGADPTGAADSSTAFQNAMDSVHAVYIPPGKYLLLSTVTITRPKIVYCFGGHYVRPSYSIDDDEEAEVRIYTTNDVDLFSIQSEQVWFHGGTYDLSSIPNPTTTIAAFHIPIICNGDLAGHTDYGGWGGGLLNVNVRGERDHLRDSDGAGATGVHYDFANQTTIWAYVTHHKVKGEFRNLRYAIRATEKNPGYNQWANNCDWDVECQAVKTAVYNGSINSTDMRVWHQGFHMFSTLAYANATPSIYIRNAGGCRLKSTRFYDFAKGTSGGYETNQKHYDILAAETELWEPDPFARAINLEQETNIQSLDHSRGFFPRRAAGTSGRGMTIPEFHDQLLQKALAATITVEAYKGTDVVSTDVETDFTALDQDSATAGITVSGEITLSNPDNIFLYEGFSAGFSMSWNATAITDNDYVEIDIDSSQSTQLSELMFTMGNEDGYHPKYIQILRGDNGSMGDNDFYTIENIGGQERSRQRIYRFNLSGSSLRRLIIRFIGSSQASAGLSVGSLSAYHNWHQQDVPIVTIHGGKRLYGELSFANGGLGNRVATTSELEDITHEINTSAYKIDGFQVWNTTTNKIVIAVGSANSSVWYDATGSLAHTPV